MIVSTGTTSFVVYVVISSFMRAHAQAIKMSWGRNVDGSGSRPKFVDGNDSVLQAWLHGRTFDFRAHGPSSRRVLTFSYFSFSFLFF